MTVGLARGNCHQANTEPRLISWLEPSSEHEDFESRDIHAGSLAIGRHGVVTVARPCGRSAQGAGRGTTRTPMITQRRWLLGVTAQ